MNPLAGLSPARMAVAAALLSIALFTFHFPGHTFLASDTQIYLPMFEHLWDPSILACDLSATRPHLAFTLYDEIAIALRHLTGAPFERVLIWQQFLFRLCGAAGLYLLARSFPLPPSMAVLVAGLSSLGAVIAGPAVLSVEYEPVPRGFAVGLLLLALGLAARGNVPAAGAAAGLAFLYHPPTALPFWLLFVPWAAWRRDFRAVAAVALSAAVLLFFALRQPGVAESQSLFGTIDPAWENLQRLRAPYNWVSAWRPALFARYLVLWLISVAAYARLRPRTAGVFLIGLPLAGILAVPGSYLLLERMRLQSIPQFQPARAVLFTALLAVTLASGAALRAALSRRPAESALWLLPAFTAPLALSDGPWQARGIAAAAAFAFGAALLLYPEWKRWRLGAVPAILICAFFLLPLLGGAAIARAPDSPELEQLAAFARSFTPKDAVFLFPRAGHSLEPGIFRARALRCVFVDWKSGGQVNFYRSLGVEWWRRWNETANRGLSPRDFERYRSLGIGYVVVEPGLRAPDREAVFRNARFAMYSVPR